MIVWSECSKCIKLQQMSRITWRKRKLYPTEIENITQTALFQENLESSSRVGNMSSFILLCISYSFVRKPFIVWPLQPVTPKMWWQRWINNVRSNFWAPFFTRESVPVFYTHGCFAGDFSSPCLSPPRVPKAWRRTFSDTQTAQDIYKLQ